MKLPAGTMYCKRHPWDLGALCVKGETLTGGNDWYRLSLDWIDGNDSGECFERLDAMLKTGTSFRVQDSECRDGMFDAMDIFLVWERLDLEFLATLTTKAIEVIDGKV